MKQKQFFDDYIDLEGKPWDFKISGIRSALVCGYRLYPIEPVARLSQEKMRWPTPQASDHRDRGHLGLPVVQRRIAKGKQLNLGLVVSDVSGALNPQWVEWLMGYPDGWTDLEGK